MRGVIMYLNYYLLIGFLLWLFLFIAGRVHCTNVVDHILASLFITALWPVVFIKMAYCILVSKHE
ncbi:hypothetical protein B8049_08835 [Klebsiella pneumoniae]|uniref:Inner membrane protein n=1 Tax=Klebsiella pneumoniae TaxID=573 RepID=A0A422Z7Z2_KLEPN|nr:hypothetical protein B5L96_14055 [Klebsiella pneumoniae]OVI12388.1 hypothetical protein B8019_27225 [Klebsiella pneumoniae]OVJ75419.1 hypothetical protein B8049_08835 [Klebsiella pneumoniae]ROG84027.1 hypothetical protein C4Y50_019525 [Klebsiella pneumoniae]SXN03699.1 Uncharacterised protein [Klebsiella pneumoniae]